MLPVSKEFHTAMIADNRRTFGRVHVDYTHPNITAMPVFGDWPDLTFHFLTPEQVVDGIIAPTRRWASCDGSTFADGGSFPMHWGSFNADQVGWWGLQMAGTAGWFVSPFPMLTMHTNPPCPCDNLRVVGDSARGEFPVDFVIRLLDAGRGLLHTHTVTGNTLIDWQATIPLIMDVRFIELEIRRWSHPGRQAKILEFVSRIQETYEGDSLISINLLEEREVSQGSLPVGIISANEISIRLDNSDRRFDAGNRESRLHGLLRQHRRIRAWLGMKGDGSGVNMQQAIDFNTGTRRNLVVNAGRLELPVVSAPAFARASDAYAQDGTLVNTNLPRFEPGRFGQAVLIEEDTTNLVAEMMSQARSGLLSNNAAISTLTLVSNFGRSSNFSALSEQVTVGENMGFFASGEANWQSVTAGLVYTASCWVFTNAVGRSATFTINYLDAVNAILGSFSGATTPLVAGTWTRITATATAPANAVRAQLGATGGITQIGEKFWYTDLQLEQRPYATSWQLGGTSRAAEMLTIPTTGVVNPVEGAVEIVWQPINQPAATMVSQHTSPQIVQMGTYHGANSWVLWVFNGRLHLYVRGAGATGWTGEWVVIPGTGWYVLNRNYHMAVTWSGSNTFHVFVDGIQYGPYVSTHAFTGVAGNFMQIGGGVGSGIMNALYDDLRISNRARTLAEHQAAFNSGQPLPVDANTTYLLRMDGNLNHGQGGDYTSPEYDLSTVGTAITSGITWQAPADGVTRDVSARLDGQAWTPVTNGGPLPFAPGQLLTGRRLQVNALLRRG